MSDFYSKWYKTPSTKGTSKMSDEEKKKRKQDLYNAALERDAASSSYAKNYDTQTISDATRLWAKSNVATGNNKYSTYDKVANSVDKKVQSESKKKYDDWLKLGSYEKERAKSLGIDTSKPFNQSDITMAEKLKAFNDAQAKKTEASKPKQSTVKKVDNKAMELLSKLGQPFKQPLQELGQDIEKYQAMSPLEAFKQGKMWQKLGAETVDTMEAFDKVALQGLRDGVFTNVDQLAEGNKKEKLAALLKMSNPATLTNEIAKGYKNAWQGNEQQTPWKDVAEHIPVVKDSKVLTGVTGFVAENALDPTNYIGAGLLKNAITGGALDTVKMTEKGAKIVPSTTRQYDVQKALSEIEKSDLPQPQKEVAKQQVVQQAQNEAQATETPVQSNQPQSNVLALPEPQSNTRAILNDVEQVLQSPDRANIISGRLNAKFSNKLDDFAYELNQTNPNDLKKQVPKSSGGIDVQSLVDARNGTTQAIEEQYQLMKQQLQAKPLQKAGVNRDEMGNVVGRNGTTSGKPSWAVEFYKANNRYPNNTELRQMADEFVRNGFKENGVDVPKFETNPQIKAIDEQISQVEDMIAQNPTEREALLPYLEGLQKDREALLPKTINRDLLGEIADTFPQRQVESSSGQLDDFANELEGMTPEQLKGAEKPTSSGEIPALNKMDAQKETPKYLEPLDEKLVRSVNSGTHFPQDWNKDYNIHIDKAENLRNQLYKKYELYPNYSEIADVIDEALDKHLTKYRTLYETYLTRRANAPSWSVTGRGNMNTTRYNKQQELTNKAAYETTEWTNGLEEYVNKKLRKFTSSGEVDVGSVTKKVAEEDKIIRSIERSLDHYSKGRDSYGWPTDKPQETIDGWIEDARTRLAKAQERKARYQQRLKDAGYVEPTEKMKFKTIQKGLLRSEEGYAVDKGWGGYFVYFDGEKLNKTGFKTQKDAKEFADVHRASLGGQTREKKNNQYLDLVQKSDVTPEQASYAERLITRANDKKVDIQGFKQNENGELLIGYKLNGEEHTMIVNENGENGSLKGSISTREGKPLRLKKQPTETPDIPYDQIPITNKIKDRAVNEEIAATSQPKDINLEEDASTRLSRALESLKKKDTFENIPVTDKVKSKPQPKESLDLLQSLKNDPKVDEAMAKLQPNPKVLGESIAEDTLKKVENLKMLPKKQKQEKAIENLVKRNKPLTKENIQTEINKLEKKSEKSSSTPATFKKEVMVKDGQIVGGGGTVIDGKVAKNQPLEQLQSIKKYDHTLSDEKALSLLGEDNKLPLNLQLFSDFKAQMELKGKTIAEVQKHWKKYKEKEWVHIAELESVGEKVTPKTLKQYKEFKQKYPDYVGNKDFKRHFQAYKQGKKVQAPVTKTEPIQNVDELIKGKVSVGEVAEKTKDPAKLIVNHVDDLYHLSKADDEAYKLGRNTRGSSRASEYIAKYGFVDADGNIVDSNSLQSIIQNYDGDLNNLREVSIALRVQDYDKLGIEAGIGKDGYTSKQVADAILKQKGDKKTVEAARKLVEYNQTLTRLYGEDFVPDVEKMIEDHPNYTPMYRVQKGGKGFIASKDKIANQKNPINALTGASNDSVIIDPIESTVKRTNVMVHVAKRNNVMKRLVEVLQDGEQSWGKIVGETDYKDFANDTDAIASTFGDTKQSKATNQALESFFGDGTNKVYAYVKGKKVEIEVSENLYNSLMNMNPEQLGFMERLLRIPVDVFRVGITNNPAFAVANAFVDQITATVMSQTNYVPFLDMARGIKSYVTKDKYAMGFVEHGGATAGIVSSDRKYTQLQLNNLMTTKQKMAKFKLDVKNAPLKELAKLTVNTPYAVIKALGDFSDIMEQGTRIGVYRKAVKSGMSGNEAAYIARDSTIDFNKGGKVGRKMNQYIAFHNVAVQGIDKNFRTLKDPKSRKKMIGMGIATITIPSLTLYNLNKDEEWYQELPTSEKNLNWHMKIGETIYRFPKPRELGVIFGSLPERMLEYLESNDKRDLKGLGGTVLDLMSPPLMPTAATPIWEVARNKNFAGVPIVSPFSQSDAPIEQQDAYTSEFSKRLAELAPTKISPKKTDHIIQGYTGSLGKTALQFSDSMFKNDTSVDKPKESGLKGSALFNRFAVKNLEGNNKFTQDFYNQWDDLKKKKQISERLGTPFNNQKYDAYKDAEKSIKELNKQKKEILNSSMSGEEKTAKLKEIGNSITRIAKGVYNFK